MQEIGIVAQLTAMPNAYDAYTASSGDKSEGFRDMLIRLTENVSGKCEEKPESALEKLMMRMAVKKETGSEKTSREEQMQNVPVAAYYFPQSSNQTALQSSLVERCESTDSLAMQRVIVRTELSDGRLIADEEAGSHTEMPGKAEAAAERAGSLLISEDSVLTTEKPGTEYPVQAESQQNGRGQRNADGFIQSSETGTAAVRKDQSEDAQQPVRRAFTMQTRNVATETAAAEGQKREKSRGFEIRDLANSLSGSEYTSIQDETSGKTGSGSFTEGFSAEQVSQAEGIPVKEQSATFLRTMETESTSVSDIREKQETKSSDKTETVVEDEPRQKIREDVDAFGKESGLSGVYSNENVVANATEDTKTEKKAVFSQVSDQIASECRQGKEEFVMELYPNEQGKVSVRMSAENGMLTVEIRAEKPETQKLILSGAEEIKSILQTALKEPVRITEAGAKEAWYDPQEQSGGSGYQRQEKEKREQEKRPGAVSQISGEMNTRDFLSIMRELGAAVRYA